MNCTKCGALLPMFTVGLCDGCRKPPPTNPKKRNSSKSETSDSSASEFEPKLHKKVKHSPNHKCERNSLSVLFIPFDAGGISRTQKGLSNFGTFGEIFLSENDSFRRLPFDEQFLKKRDLQQMPQMTSKDLVSMQSNPKVTLSFQPEPPKKVLSKIEDTKARWDFDYETIACAAVSKLGTAHDRQWEKSLFEHMRVGSLPSRIKCGCSQHIRPSVDVPRVFPDVIFLSEELNYNKFPDKLSIHGVDYLRVKESALAYNDKGGVSEWKQQIAGYVRSAHRDDEEKRATFSAKRAVTDQKENVLLVTKALDGIELVACGVHFSSAYVGQCKNNDQKAREVLEQKFEWSRSSGADLLIGDFNLDCSFDTNFMPEYVSGPKYISVGDRLEQVVSTRASNTSQTAPQRFMNAVVTNDLARIEPPNELSTTARPVIGDQSVDSGYYSDHPWIFVAVSKGRATHPFNLLNIPTLPMLTWK